MLKLLSCVTGRTDNAIKNRYYSTMRRMQRQSLRKKGPLREGKSIRVATVNSATSSPMPSPSAPPSLAHAGGNASHRQLSQPTAFQKLFNMEHDRVRSNHILLSYLAYLIRHSTLGTASLGLRASARCFGWTTSPPLTRVPSDVEWGILDGNEWGPWLANKYHGWAGTDPGVRLHVDATVEFPTQSCSIRTVFAFACERDGQLPSALFVQRFAVGLSD
jgi:hypothetical protein